MESQALQGVLWNVLFKSALASSLSSPLLSGSLAVPPHHLTAVVFSAVCQIAPPSRKALKRPKVAWRNVEGYSRRLDCKPELCQTKRLGSLIAWCAFRSAPPDF